MFTVSTFSSDILPSLNSDLVFIPTAPLKITLIKGNWEPCLFSPFSLKHFSSFGFRHSSFHQFFNYFTPVWLLLLQTSKCPTAQFLPLIFLCTHSQPDPAFFNIICKSMTPTFVSSIQFSPFSSKLGYPRIFLTLFRQASQAYIPKAECWEILLYCQHSPCWEIVLDSMRCPHQKPRCHPQCLSFLRLSISSSLSPVLSGSSIFQIYLDYDYLLLPLPLPIQAKPPLSPASTSGIPFYLGSSFFPLLQLSSMEQGKQFS